MLTLETTFAGLQLKNPLIAASSGLTNSLKKIKELEEAGIGAVVLKSLFEEQIESHSGQLSQMTDYPEASDYINAYVEMNHMEKYLNLIRSAKEECNIPIVASINCYTQSRWIEFARTVQDAGADALELNLFLLNAGDHGDTWLEESYVNIVRELKKVLTIPLVIKMAKTISNLPGLVGRLKALGAAGVVLFNRFYQPDIDINKMEIVSGPVFSTPSDFSDTLRWTAIVSGRVPKFDIACSYGVHGWEAVVKGILAGRVFSSVVCCMEEGFCCYRDADCLEEWMKQNNYSTISEFRGKLSYSKVKDPSLYERVQFMKYFSEFKG